MFGWLSRKLRAENATLRAQVVDLATKAAYAGDLIANSGRGGLTLAPNNLAEAREQLGHFTGWQYVAIRAIATRTAGQEAFVASEPLGPRGMKAAGNDLEPLPAHPLIEAINDPNDLMVRWSLLFVTVCQLELTGLAYWWLAENPSGWLDIWPLPPDWVSPNPGRKTWKIRPPGDPQGFDVAYDDVACFSLPDPANPLGATSPLQTQAKAVDADERLQTCQSRAFSNGIHPGMAIIVAKMEGPDGNVLNARPVLTPEQQGQLIDGMRAMYGGATNYGEPFIVDGRIEDIKKITNTPAEMDFLESGKQTKSRIFKAFGVNPLIVGEIEGANRAQAYVAEQSFAANVVNPLLVLMGQVISAWVCPRFARPSERLTAWFAPVVPRDDDLDSRNWNTALTRQAVTVNEYRRHVLNLADVPWGDEPISADSGPLVAPAEEKRFDPFDPFTLKRLGLANPPGLSLNGRH